MCVCVCVWCMHVGVCVQREAASRVFIISSPLVCLHVLLFLLYTVWAQQAIDNLRPFVRIAPTRKCSNENWLVSGWRQEPRAEGGWGVGEAFVSFGASPSPPSGTHSRRGQPHSLSSGPESDCALVPRTLLRAEFSDLSLIS